MKERTNIGKPKKQLAECQKIRDEYLNSWKKERANFLNYKKEESERISGLMKFANEELILKILPILDNLEIAARQNFLPENLSGQEKERFNQFIQGFLQIKTQILDFLKNQGVEEIKCLGEKFDPNFQEAVEEVEKKNTKPGTVIEEVKKGYKLNGRVIRPAKVKISK